MVLGDHVLARVSSELGAVCEALVTLVTPQVLVCTVGRHVSDHLATRREHLVTLVTLREGCQRLHFSNAWRNRIAN